MMIKASDWSNLPKFIQLRKLERAVKNNRLKGAK